ncbi:MAG: hypothetical protein V4736_06260 [Bdellovibrionota bacterium]
MRRFDWSEHYPELAARVESKSTLRELLLGGALDPLDFSKKVSLSLGFPRLQSEFFTSASPTQEFYKQWQSFHSWNADCLPLGEWDGHLYVGFWCDSPELPASLKAIPVVVSARDLQSLWQNYQGATASEPLAIAEAPVFSLDSILTGEHTNAAKTPKIEFPVSESDDVIEIAEVAIPDLPVVKADPVALDPADALASFVIPTAKPTGKEEFNPDALSVPAVPAGKPAANDEFVLSDEVTNSGVDLSASAGEPEGNELLEFGNVEPIKLDFSKSPDLASALAAPLKTEQAPEEKPVSEAPSFFATNPVPVVTAVPEEEAAPEAVTSNAIKVEMEVPVKAKPRLEIPSMPSVASIAAAAAAKPASTSAIPSIPDLSEATLTKSAVNTKTNVAVSSQTSAGVSSKTNPGIPKGIPSSLPPLPKTIEEKTEIKAVPNVLTTVATKDADGFELAGILNKVGNGDTFLKSLHQLGHAEYDSFSLWALNSNGQKIHSVTDGTEFSVDDCNFFRLVLNTDKPFHGKPTINPWTQKFFTKIESGETPSTVTILPLYRKDQLLGFGYFSAKTRTHGLKVLNHLATDFQKVAESMLANNLKKAA